MTALEESEHLKSRSRPKPQTQQQVHYLNKQHASCPVMYSNQYSDEILRNGKEVQHFSKKQFKSHGLPVNKLLTFTLTTLGDSLIRKILITPP